MKNIYLFLALMISAVSGSTSAQTVATSIYTILGNPKAFNEKQVLVEGVLGLIGEDTILLYADRGSFESGITINSILVTMTFQGAGGEIAGLRNKDLVQMNGKYVGIWCTYYYSSPRAHVYTGQVGKITRMQLVPNFPALFNAEKE